jgi:hypothetical protein
MYLSGKLPYSGLRKINEGENRYRSITAILTPVTKLQNIM